MRFIIHVIFPISAIILGTLLIMYSATNHGTIIRLILGGSIFLLSILPMYYFFCKIYPDSNNIGIPPQFVPKSELSQIGKAKETKAYENTAGLAYFAFALGAFLWYYLPVKYTKNELLKYGTETTAKITGEEFSKIDFGSVKYYKFKDKLGNRHEGYFKDHRLKMGDSINVIYSSNRPEINVAQN